MVTANARPESSSLSARGDPGVKAGDAKSKIGEVAGEVADEAKRSAATLASEANNKMWDFMDEQAGAGANLVGHVAASTRLAAEDLERNAPQLAGLVRDVSRKMEQFSQEIRGQSVNQLMRRSSDFARERPAVMFGAAAACGFFLFRLFKAGSAVSTEGSRSQNAKGGTAYGPASSASPHYDQSHGA
jgi:ElaB/YqjD/DUF883 family membrane-anchored ribosome-binding protein